MGTTAKGFRYPDPSVALGNIDAAVKDLADDVNSRVGHVQSGTGVVVVTASTTGTLAVAFPQAFATAPHVVATARNPNYFASISNVTVNGFDLTVRHYTNTSATINVSTDWIARR